MKTDSELLTIGRIAYNNASGLSPQPSDAAGLAAVRAVREALQASGDAINPRHYRLHPSGVECIQLTERMPFCEGNAVKYLWRYSMKDGRRDLEKALWFLERVIQRPKLTEALASPAASRWHSWFARCANPSMPDCAIRALLNGCPVTASEIVKDILETY